MFFQPVLGCLEVGYLRSDVLPEERRMVVFKQVSQLVDDNVSHLIRLSRHAICHNSPPRRNFRKAISHWLPRERLRG